MVSIASSCQGTHTGDGLGMEDGVHCLQLSGDSYWGWARHGRWCPLPPAVRGLILGMSLTRMMTTHKDVCRSVGMVFYALLVAESLRD